MFPHNPKSSTFPLYEETILAEKVAFLTWNPCNDLCVLVHQDNSVALCRAGTVPIWQIDTMASKVTCVSWHPNGQEFAIGCQDGTVFQLNAVHYIPHPVQCWPPSEFNTDRSSNSNNNTITSLLWLDYSPEQPDIIVPGFDPTCFDMRDHLPELSMVPPEGPMPALLFQRPNKISLPDPPMSISKTQSLLLIGDQNANLYLCLNAGYHIGTIQCSQQHSSGSIVDINVCEDLSSIQILVQHASVNINSYEIVTFDSQFLQRKKTSICNIAAVEHHIGHLLRYLNQCTDLIQAHHATFTKLAKSSSNNIAIILNEDNPDTIPLPQVELVGALATGNLNHALHEYFTENLSQQQAKQWATRAMHSYTSVQRIIMEYLQPACERLLLHLSKLQSYALWTERYADLLCSELITKAIKITQQYFCTIHQLLVSVGEVSRRFQEFIRWIIRTIQNLAEQSQMDDIETPSGPQYDHPELVMQYLVQDYYTDSLEDYFRQENANPSSFVVDNPSMIRSLPIIFREMFAHCNAILEKPCSTVHLQVNILDRTLLRLSTPNIINNHFQLPSSYGEARMRSAVSQIIEDNDTITRYYAFVKRDSNEGEDLVIVRSLWKKLFDRYQHRYLTSPAVPPSSECTLKEYSTVKLDRNWQVSDLEFLDHKELALIIQPKNGHDNITNSYLTAIEFDECLCYQTLNNIAMEPTRQQQLLDTRLRYIELNNMIDSVIGANGRPKRRILAVAAKNGIFKVLEMEENEDTPEEEGGF